MQFPRTLGTLAVALGLFATSCGGGASIVATETAQPVDSAAAAPTQPAAEQAAPAVLLPTVDGGQIDLTSLEGQDVVLWFWAPW